VSCVSLFGLLGFRQSAICCLVGMEILEGETLMSM
jgi:hypothetical protein